MKEKKAKELLEKYLSGAATAQEQGLVDEWYNAIEFKGTLSADQKQQLGSSAKEALQARTRPIRKIKLYRPWIQAAAAVVLIVLGSIWFTRYKPTQADQELIVLSNGSASTLLSLPDGSVVTLQAYSTLAYPRHFTKSERRVFLREGAAFFDVKHDEKRRFAVATSLGLDVKVLGTSFLVKAFAKQEEILIAVSTGKVAVDRQNERLGLLNRGEQLLFDKDTKTFRLSKNTEVKTVPIHFNGSTINEVAKKLAYVYNVKLKLDPSVDSKLKTTARFNSSLSITEMLGLICKLHQLRFKIAADQQTYILYK